MGGTLRVRVAAGTALAVAAATAAAVAWPLPPVQALPALVRTRLASHGGSYVPLQRVPWALRAGVVAVEDDTFYRNPGVDVASLLRAALADLRAGRIVQGGSTLTEQLADVVIVHGDRTPLRRLATMLLALRIARTYPKATVLELYLNAVYFGEGAYGIGRAAHVYFHRPVEDLDLAQCALLAGLPQAPARYDPAQHPRAALRRAREVLAAMVRSHDIGPRAAEAALAELSRWLALPVPGPQRPVRG
jgi:membrane peptidoglycan carboxypeptidase